MHISEEAREAVNRHFCDALLETANRWKSPAGAMFGRYRKNHSLVRAREELFEYMRETVSYCNVDRERKFALHKPGERPAGWKPMSFPDIAAMFGMNHSTVIQGRKRKANRERRERQQAGSPGLLEATSNKQEATAD